MCSQYVNTGVYDAKSELFAFGIVLAELYGGKLQNADGVSIDDEAIEEDRVAPDVRIAAEPGVLAARWKELCINCVKRYSRRLATMQQVVEVLELLVGAVGAAAGDEEELSRLRMELEEVRLKNAVEERLRRDELRQAIAQDLRDIGVVL
jgi:hypothetical protein